MEFAGHSVLLVVPMRLLALRWQSKGLMYHYALALCFAAGAHTIMSEGMPDQAFMS